ncbi:hypothetical protein DITRI_Ditri05aG0003000 [Diplodiscus trichospermus]
MQTSSLYRSQKSVRIHHHDDFFTRCSIREDSIINLSFEDYHGGTSVTVPFNWESEPGTPKVKSREIPSLPPLTPPPSYFYSTPKRIVKNQSKPKFLVNIFPKRLRRKTPVQLSPASSSSSSSSSSSTTSSRSSSPWPRSYSVPSSPMRASNLYAQNELSRARLFCDSKAEEEEHEYESSVSTPCFGRGASTRSRGFCSAMLKVLLRDQ